jgi:hypothetical protein
MAIKEIKATAITEYKRDPFVNSLIGSVFTMVLTTPNS